MITDPTRQRALRGHKPTRPNPRVANTAEHQAVLAWRLTARDKWIARMLWEHRVLTAHQLTALAFPSFRSGRMRLRELYTWGVLDRFQPFVTIGTAPMHYVLAPAGAAVLAAEDGVDVKDMGYRHDRVFGVAHSLRLAHTVGVNEWFTALVDRARHPRPGEQATLVAWWSETRCARHFGDLVKPDGYGRWQHRDRHGDRQVEWFLEYDFGTEVLGKLAGKLTGYAALAQATGITTPLLVWLPTARREATARRLLARAWRELEDPRAVPVATAAADLLNPDATHPSPADEVWLPLNTPAGGGRQTLTGLLDAWPHLPPPVTTTDPTALGVEAHPVSPPPPPMPPAVPPRTPDRPGRR
ncbi:replication-relaxation family protein [Actinokineospora spheciospongiae]|uniref:replication-relaxation family protein n=1 Tax=Actinokineospora spheciospongiae TaxID=909613 RepID=UPI000D71BA81|nr:replication-relaxation family protein [Actinokineospora spheciospongiae]PWW53135.1 protein involved in plasmid replication-relaxation [Actinokineospora spheciospongiae]